MKKWGVLVTLFFGVVFLALIVPAFYLLAASSPTAHDVFSLYGEWATWMFAALAVAGQTLLLWLRVDTTQKRLKPRTHIAISSATAAFFMMVLTLGIIFAVGVIARGDKFFDDATVAGWFAVIGGIVVPWLIWGILFYRFWRNSSDPITQAVAWLFRGSVLELLIAVPAHVIVRRRNECSAPVATSFGIASGIAIMLMSFGPSVLLLFKKRMDMYSKQPQA